MFVQYIGPERGRVIAIEGRPVHVDRGGVIEVPARLGAQLCRQKRVWREAILDMDQAESLQEAEGALSPSDVKVTVNGEPVEGRWAVTDPDGLISDQVWTILNREYPEGPQMVEAASDEELLAINGIGQSTLEKIRRVLSEESES